MTIRAIRVRGSLSKGLLFVFAAALASLGLFAIYLFQPYVGSENSDSEFGYYGQYNRVKHILEAMPNIMIVARWRHDDLTLEDFGFTLLMDGTRLVQVNVHETSLEMRTRRKGRLRELLQKQIDANQLPEEWQKKGLFPDEYYEKSPELKAWRQTQPDPVPAKPIDPKQRMLARRKLRPGESLPSPVDANRPAGEPAEGRPTTIQPDPAVRSTPREP